MRGSERGLMRAHPGRHPGGHLSYQTATRLHTRRTHLKPLYSTVRQTSIVYIIHESALQALSPSACRPTYVREEYCGLAYLVSPCLRPVQRPGCLSLMLLCRSTPPPLPPTHAHSPARGKQFCNKGFVRLSLTFQTASMGR